MPKDHEKQRVFTRRAVLLGGAQMATFAILAGRLAYLQFIKSDEYATLSQNNHIKLQPIAPPRGLILDRFGIPIADNEKNYRVYLDATGLSVESYKTAVKKLQELLALPEKETQQLLGLKPQTILGPQLIKDHLTWEELSRVELNSLYLPGTFIEIGHIRRYLFGEKAAHLTGYLGSASEEEMKNDEQEALLRSPDFKIGKNGIEKMLESRLRGTAGMRQLEVNVHNIVVREAGKTESVPGENIRLTIDSRAQDAAAEKLKGQSGSAVAIEVETGNVLVLASMPAYDPNQFSLGITNDEWKKLSADKKIPLLNKAIGGMYPPGSTFKMMVGMAGLEAGIFKPPFQVFCPGYFMLGNHRFGCWKPGGHGTVNYHQAVEQSCDTFFYTVAQRMGAQAYADMCRRFGMGRIYNLGIIGEKLGIVPDPAWKKKTYKQEWTAGDTINCSIGQGYVLATPLQLAVMAARLACGKQVMPRLVVPPGQETVSFDPVDIDPGILQLTQTAMAAVVNSGSGTAYGSRIPDPRFSFAGKTGTSQVRKLIQLGMNQNLLPWEFRHHGLFIGFAPVDKPKYAVAVVVEHGGGGASAAAPVAKEILWMLQKIEAEKG